MKIQKTELPNLPQHFENTKEFAEFIRPYFDEDHNNTVWKDVLIPDAIHKFMFSNKGWRLTPTGADMLMQHYKSYQSTHEDNCIITGKLLIQMNRLINGPWILRNRTVTIWNSQIHFELQLVGGKLLDLIDFKC